MCSQGEMRGEDLKALWHSPGRECDGSWQQRPRHSTRTRYRKKGTLVAGTGRQAGHLLQNPGPSTQDLGGQQRCCSRAFGSGHDTLPTPRPLAGPRSGPAGAVSCVPVEVALSPLWRSHPGRPLQWAGLKRRVVGWASGRLMAKEEDGAQEREWWRLSAPSSSIYTQE